MRTKVFPLVGFVCALVASPVPAQENVELDGLTLSLPYGWMRVFVNGSQFPEYAFYQFVHPSAGHSMSVEIRTHEDGEHRTAWMLDFIRSEISHMGRIDRLSESECGEVMPRCTGMIVSSDDLNYRMYVLYVETEGRDYRILIGGRANLFDESTTLYRRILLSMRFRTRS